MPEPLPTDRRTVLLTGFGPFEGVARNPSIEAVRIVERGWDRPERLVAVELPVSYDRSAAALSELFDRHRPAVVIGVGVAAGRERVGLERVAVNLRDARIADVDGARPVDVPVQDGGPTAYLTSVPVKHALRRLVDDDVPAELSMTAGTYVCNAVLYRSAHWAHAQPGARAGFVHVPPTLPDDVLARAVRHVVDVALDEAADLAVPAGADS